jgi:puromycin-sensitive aminopeptidase
LVTVLIFFPCSCSGLPILQFASFEEAKEIEEFFASYTKAKFDRALKQSIERVHINANWVQSVQNEEHLAKAVKELVPIPM